VVENVSHVSLNSTTRPPIFVFIFYHRLSSFINRLLPEPFPCANELSSLKITSSDEIKEWKYQNHGKMDYQILITDMKQKACHSVKRMTFRSVQTWAACRFVTSSRFVRRYDRIAIARTETKQIIQSSHHNTVNWRDNVQCVFASSPTLSDDLITKLKCEVFADDTGSIGVASKLHNSLMNHRCERRIKRMLGFGMRHKNLDWISTCFPHLNSCLFLNASMIRARKWSTHLLIIPSSHKQIFCPTGEEAVGEDHRYISNGN